MNYQTRQSLFSGEESHDDETVMRELLHVVKGLMPISGVPELEFVGEEAELSAIQAYDFE